MSTTVSTERLSTIFFGVSLMPFSISFLLYYQEMLNLAGLTFCLAIALALLATSLGSPLSGGLLLAIFLLLGAMIYSKDGKEANKVIGIYIIGTAALVIVGWVLLAWVTRHKGLNGAERSG